MTFEQLLRRMAVVSTPAAALCLAAAPVHAQTTAPILVDPSVQYQTFEGWGTSLAWWAKVVGGYPEPARSDYIDKAFDPVKGLGLNVVRYNIGGGENPQYLAPNKQYLQFRANMPGFEPSPGQWDWSADANQRWVLQAAIRKGADQLEAFSNSPPYWMTISGSVTGNVKSADNLKDDSFDAFADYQTEVVKHFRDDWGVTFRDVEPLNEPSGSWWSFGRWQECCHVDRASQNRLVNAVGAAVARKGLKIPVSASDENTIGDGVRTFGYYDATALAAMNKVNVHSYGGGDRTQLFELANSAGKDVWLSEYGDNDASGLTMSRRILQDMNGLHPTAWVYWQLVDAGNGWGFLKNPQQDETTTDYVINEKYYVMGNYSKFIRPGFRLMAIVDPNSLAAYDAKSRRLVIVTTNDTDAPASGVYDLSRFARLGKTVAVYRTSLTENLAALPAIAVDKKRFSTGLPAKSVTTFVIDGVNYSGRGDFAYKAYSLLMNAAGGKQLAIAGDAEAAAPALSPNLAGAPRGQWNLIGQGNGVYKIVNRGSGLVLDVNQASTEPGGKVIQYADNGGENQLWTLKRTAGDRYEIVNRHSGLVLSAVGDRLTQQKEDGGGAQQWRIELAER